MISGQYIIKVKITNWYDRHECAMAPKSDQHFPPKMGTQKYIIIFRPYGLRISKNLFQTICALDQIVCISVIII